MSGIPVLAFASKRASCWSLVVMVRRRVRRSTAILCTTPVPGIGNFVSGGIWIKALIKRWVFWDLWRALRLLGVHVPTYFKQHLGQLGEDILNFRSFSPSSRLAARRLTPAGRGFLLFLEVFLGLQREFFIRSCWLAEDPGEVSVLAILFWS